MKDVELFWIKGDSKINKYMQWKKKKGRKEGKEKGREEKKVREAGKGGECKKEKDSSGGHDLDIWNSNMGHILENISVSI